MEESVPLRWIPVVAEGVPPSETVDQGPHYDS